jgi:hypothetical protein
MKKPTQGKVALINFLEAVEVDRVNNKKPDNTKKLVDYMTSKKRDCDGSDNIANKVAMKQKELKSGTPNNPRVDEDEEECGMNEASFSRQHYESIAKILKDADANEDNPAATRAIQSIGENLADLFRKDNPRFDEPKFLTAAGLEDSSAETHYKERG